MVYLSLDIEASGPFPGLFSLVSLGAIAVRGDDKRSWRVDRELVFYQEVQPLKGADELSAATKIHGLSHDYLLANGKDPSTAMLDFLSFFKDLEQKFKKVIPAAWPSSFDAPFIGWYLQRFTGSNPLGWSTFDIPSFAMGLFRCHRNAVKGHMKKVGILYGHNPTPHNALTDAIEQGETLAQLLNHSRILRKEARRLPTPLTL